MKINFDLKCKIPSVEFCYNNKRVIIRYWGRLKFDKFVFYGGEEMSNNKQIEKPLELPHQETIVGTNTIQTKPFDNQKIMSNNKQSSVKWFLDKLIEHQIIKVGQTTYEGKYKHETLLEQAKEMEVAGREMSYDEGYKEGYKRALELIEWKIQQIKDK